MNDGDGLPDMDGAHRLSRKQKTALVLSAGGVYGAYQVGVWKALADVFRPDLVVGASIGSVNGWLIAGGCPPLELESLWLGSELHLAVRPRWPRHWSHGCLDPKPVVAVLDEIFKRYTPQIEYAAVLTDIFRMKPCLFTTPNFSSQHLLASCAVPGAFDLQRLDGRMYADGGLLGAVPLWAAVELGATRIIAVYPLPAPPRLLRWTATAFRKTSRRGVASYPDVEIIQIVPDPPLGSFWKMLRYRRESIREWIGRGEHDALQLRPVLVESFEGQ